ncbi:MAG: FKBP-type peptidyl-prolyl cis-trans isomerase [Ekhidna sp.]|nr:FKBP-type peptidyl-prolyl cis-trans isomerase [Ekhidna sp.]
MKKGLLAIFVGFLLIACGDGNVVIAVDPAEQFESDSAKIREYLQMQGFTDEEIGVTENGINYVIIDPGTGEMIDESDFVEYNYIGKTLGDTIFDTTIEIIADSVRSHYLQDSVGQDNKLIHEAFLARFNDVANYEPDFIVYSSSGWTIPDGYPYRTPTFSFGEGYKNGLSLVLGKLNIGGKAIFLFPSALGFGPAGNSLVPANKPLIFEISPVEITKQ